MDPATFWASSPRAVHLVVRAARRRWNTSGSPLRRGPLPSRLRRATFPRGEGDGRPGKGVRLSRLPHP